MYTITDEMYALAYRGEIEKLLLITWIKILIGNYV